jgi:hypothetical protein
MKIAYITTASKGTEDTEYMERHKRKISTSKYPVRILTDDQALLIQGDSVKLIGEGKEIQI